MDNPQDEKGRNDMTREQWEADVRTRMALRGVVAKWRPRLPDGHWVCSGCGTVIHIAETADENRDRVLAEHKAKFPNEEPVLDQRVCDKCYKIMMEEHDRIPYRGD
jgi:hypothetical protein